MKDKKKQNRTLSVILFFLVATGLFYLLVAYDFPIAIHSGGLLNSKPTPSINTDLNIIKAYVAEAESDDTASISSDGKSLSFSVLLDTTYSKKVKFKIKNVGNTDTILGTLSTYNPAISSGITVIWPNLSNLVLKPNQESEEFSIVILWDGRGNKEKTTFSAELNYMQYVVK